MVVDGLFKQFTLGSSPCHHAVECLMECPIDVERTIDELKKSDAHHGLVRILHQSESPDARKAIFEIGLSHERQCVVDESAKAIEAYSRACGAGLTVGEQVLVVGALEKNQKICDDGRDALVRSLRKPKADEVIRFLIKTGSRVSMLAVADCPDCEMLLRNGAAMPLVMFDRDASYYAPPSTWYVNWEIVGDVVHCRMVGIELLQMEVCGAKISDDDSEALKKLGEVLYVLRKQGIEHMTQGQYNRTRRYAASVILEILEFHGRTFDDKRMEELRRIRR